jgi:hypothetical protein
MPEPTASKTQLENIDCLICHQVQYKRVKSGGVFIPDTANMAITMDQAVQTVHQPVRANCLQCHATPGGGDAYKRGDLTLAHGKTTDTIFDSHMATAGLNLQCQDCHKVSNHRIAGRGSDIAQTDYDFPMGCSTTECHAAKGSPGGHTTQAVNRHVNRVACQTCHISTYGKNASDTIASEATEVHRDWTDPHFNTTTSQYHPRSDLLNNLIPVYKFWNKYSTNYLLYDVTAPNPITGNYTTSKPVGSINDLTTASKLYPFKFKTAFQPIATRLNVLIAIDTSVYWTGNFTTPAERVAAAVAAGLTNMGFSKSEPYAFVNTETNQLITHGVPPASQTLSCNDCHGSTNQMNLRDIGYQLKNSTQIVCTQCHGVKNKQMTFEELHKKHVQDKKEGCSWCHNFSRPERGLNENYQTHMLTVTKPGTGVGTVTSADGGINCGTDCTETYGHGTKVTLTTEPVQGSFFAGWSGGGCSGTGTCEVTLNGAITVTATFTLAGSPPELTPIEGTIGTQLTITGSDFGTMRGKVLIGGVAVYIARGDWTDNRIIGTIKRPPLPIEEPHPVAVVVNRVSIPLDSTFTLRNLVVDNLLDSSGRFPDEITVTGMFFGVRKGRAYLEHPVSGRKKYLRVTYWNMIPSTGVSELRFRVPKPSRLFPADAYPLKVANKVGIATASTNFTLEPLP